MACTCEVFCHRCTMPIYVSETELLAISMSKATAPSISGSAICLFPEFSVWEERFCVLKANLLFTYANKESKHPMSIRIMESIVADIIPKHVASMVPNANRNAHGIRIRYVSPMLTGDEGQLFLMFQSSDVSERWINILNASSNNALMNIANQKDDEIIDLKNQLDSLESLIETGEKQRAKDNESLKTQISTQGATIRALKDENKRLMDKIHSLEKAIESSGESKEQKISAAKREYTELASTNAALRTRIKQLEMDFAHEQRAGLQQSRQLSELQQQVTSLFKELEEHSDSPEALALKLVEAQQKAARCVRYNGKLQAQLMEREKMIYQTGTDANTRISEAVNLIGDEALISYLQSQVDLLNWRLYFVEECEKLTAHEKFDVKRRMKILLEELEVHEATCKAQSLRLRAFTLNEQLRLAYVGSEDSPLLEIVFNLIQRHNRALDVSVPIPSTPDEENAIRNVWGPRVRFIRLPTRIGEIAGKDDLTVMAGEIAVQIRGRPPREDPAQPIGTLATTDGNVVLDAAGHRVLVLGKWLHTMPESMVRESRFKELEKQMIKIEKKADRAMTEWDAINAKYNRVITEYKTMKKSMVSYESKIKSLQSEVTDLKRLNSNKKANEHEFLDMVGTWWADD